MSTIRLLWTLSALAAMAAGLVLGIGVATLYSARWLSGMTPALGLLLLQACQVALGLAAAVAPAERHWWVTLSAGALLLAGNAAVALALPGVTGQWMFLVPLVPLLLAVASTLVLVLARQRGSQEPARSSQDR